MWFFHKKSNKEQARQHIPAIESYLSQIQEELSVEQEYGYEKPSTNVTANTPHVQYQRWDNSDDIVAQALHDLKGIRRKQEATFVDRVNAAIAKDHLRAKDIYTAARIDRKLFSKVMADTQYKPAKDTCIALMLALHINGDEAVEWLKSAGYALSKINRRDMILQYFFLNEIFSVDDLNEVLYSMDEKILGRQ